jgi:hypothetical protein
MQTKLKKVLSCLTSAFVLVTSLLSGVAAVQAEAASSGVQAVVQPSDIKGHWAETQISSGVNRGLIKGYEDGTFKPENSITRAEFMAIVNRAFGYSEKAQISFSDVSANDWYAEEAAKAKAVEYITGYDDGSMKPNNKITRQEAAVMLSRVLKLDKAQNAAVLDVFNDKQNIAAWSKDAVAAVAENGYIKGYPDKTYKPGNPITRAEAVVMLDRAVGTLYNQAGTYGPEEGKQTIEGNVTVTGEITLRNMEIKGNLYLTEGIGQGNAALDNVVVQGTTLICGGGENSITVKDSQLKKVKLAKKDGKIRLETSGNTVVEQLLVFVKAKLDILGGSIGKLEIGDKAKDTVIQIDKAAMVDTITFNAPASVKGEGKIKNAVININGVTIQQQPDNVTIGDNLTAFINGKEVKGKQTDSSSGGSSGGSGGSSDGSGGSDTTSISITKINDVKIVSGTSKDITVTTNPDSATITATASDANIIGLSVNGSKITITAKKEGATTVTVTAQKSGYTNGTTTFNVEVVKSMLPASHTLPDVLDAIEKALLSLEDDAWTTLKEHRDDFLSLSDDRIIGFLQEIGLAQPFEEIVNSDITEDEARFILGVIRSLSYLGRDNIVASREIISDEIKELKTMYSSQLSTLVSKGVTQEAIYNYIVDCYNYAMNSDDSRKNSDSDKDYEAFIYDVALTVVKRTEHDALEAIAKTSYEKTREYMAAKYSDFAIIIENFDFEEVDGELLVSIRQFLTDKADGVQEYKDLNSLMEFMLEISKVFLK